MKIKNLKKILKSEGWNLIKINNGYYIHNEGVGEYPVKLFIKSKPKLSDVINGLDSFNIDNYCLEVIDASRYNKSKWIPIPYLAQEAVYIEKQINRIIGKLYEKE